MKRPFETTTQQAERHFRNVLLIISGILLFLLFLQSEILKQHHEMEINTNKKYLNK